MDVNQKENDHEHVSVVDEGAWGVTCMLTEAWDNLPMVVVTKLSIGANEYARAVRVLKGGV